MPSLSSNSIAQLGKSSSSESLTKISASLSSLQLSSAEPSAPDRPTSSSAYRVEGLSLSSQSSVPSLPPITAKPEPQPARPSSAMTKSTFVPMCDGSRGLNLDLSQFLQEVPTAMKSHRVEACLLIHALCCLASSWTPTNDAFTNCWTYCTIYTRCRAFRLSSISSHIRFIYPVKSSHAHKAPP